MTGDKNYKPSNEEEDMLVNSPSQDSITSNNKIMQDIQEEKENTRNKRKNREENSMIGIIKSKELMEDQGTPNSFLSRSEAKTGVKDMSNTWGTKEGKTTK